MSSTRPTFSDAWHRVASLRPRLRASARVVRQVFRSRPWYVVEERHANQFVRLSEPAWRIVGLLDGRRTVEEAWQLTLEQLGDEAPTQPEVIQVLSQLHQGNLLHMDAPPDVDALLRRRRQRVRREVRGHVGNLLFIRIPLIDPDRLLDRILPLAGPLVSLPGLLLWILVITVGAARLIGRTDELASGIGGVLSTDNLPLLYLTFAAVKLVHELAHGIFCKKFGRTAGGGEVRSLGVMLLLFMPIPYVDASSAWALRSRTQRALVGAAGMIAELAIAAVAAVVWTSTAPGSVPNAIAFNVIFVAGVSTLLFNGNPLLRYDGYYMLSDLTDTPNLAQRGTQYIQFLVKRFAWKVRGARNPAYSRAEGLWLGSYAVASLVYRVFVYAGIIVFIADQQFLLGLVLIAAACIGFLIVPLGVYVNFLLTSPELQRSRGRAVATSMLLALATAAAGFTIPVPDHQRAEALLRGGDHVVISAGISGVLLDILPDGARVEPGADVIVRSESTTWEIRARMVQAELEAARLGRRQALGREPARVRQFEEQIITIEEHAGWIRSQLHDASVSAPVAGAWICPDWRRLRGAYLNRGEPIGIVTSPERIEARAVLPQRLAALILRESRPGAEVRVDGDPSFTWHARLLDVRPAGTDDLPGEALGIFAGGSTLTDPRAAGGAQAMERFFEARLAIDGDVSRLRPGQRMIVRFRLDDRPIFLQGARWMRQVFQERFRL